MFCFYRNQWPLREIQAGRPSGVQIEDSIPRPQSNMGRKFYGPYRRPVRPTSDQSFRLRLGFAGERFKSNGYISSIRLVNVVLSQDDFMGSCQLELTSLELGRMMDISISLQNPAKVGASLGEISLTVTLYPKTQEDKEQVRWDGTIF